MIGSCPKCGHSLRMQPPSDAKDLPHAHTMRLIHVGKMVYSIDGIPGLYCIGGHYSSPTRVEALSKTNKSLFFERLPELERQIMTVLAVSNKRSVGSQSQDGAKFVCQMES